MLTRPSAATFLLLTAILARSTLAGPSLFGGGCKAIKKAEYQLKTDPSAAIKKILGADIQAYLNIEPKPQVKLRSLRSFLKHSGNPLADCYAKDPEQANAFIQSVQSTLQEEVKDQNYVDFLKDPTIQAFVEEMYGAHGSHLPGVEYYANWGSDISDAPADEYSADSPGYDERIDHSEDGDRLPSYAEVADQEMSASLDDDYNFRPGSSWNDESGESESQRLTAAAKVDVNKIMEFYFAELPKRIRELSV
ncbi:hypothetical protein H4R33_002700 [Dimargaris cristalligena]|nr:hypothetical protein H4R33_002700 [Dimargaris cristalligena]